RRRPYERGIEQHARQSRQGGVLVAARQVASRDLAREFARELETGTHLAADPVGIAVETGAVGDDIMPARVRVDFHERLDARQQVVTGSQLAAVLDVVAVVVALGRSVNELRSLIDRSVNAAFERDLEAVEALAEAGAAAERREDRKPREVGLDVRTAGPVGTQDEAAFKI